jgi:predicted ester cyclase
VGAFFGVPPTGARLTVRGLTAYELRDERIVGHWEQFDVPAILSALGLFPPANQGHP